jgi:hypothetical protein|tara:strand:+ start:490 stop:753 length:264 start_codon:yes stop_codon:yes gene_type:complete
MTSGKNSMISKAGLTVPLEYFIKIGVTVLSAKKAPFLNWRMPEPLEVPASAKMRNYANLPVSSIISYRSLMAPSALALLSSLPPLGM